MNGMKKIAMLLAILAVCMMLPAGSFALEQTENTLKDEGLLPAPEMRTYHFEVKTKSNVIINFRDYAAGLYKLKIYDSSGKVVYKPPGYVGDEKTYDFCYAPAKELIQHKTILPKGKYKMTIKSVNPWNWTHADFDFTLDMKWAPLSEQLDEFVIPQKPTLEAIANVDGSVSLSWTKSEGADKYIAWRRIGYATHYIGETTDLFITDTGGKGGTKYIYIIEAKNIENPDKGSTDSNWVPITVKLGRPDVKASNLASSGKVKLSWKKIKGASKYKVYRASSKNGKYYLQKSLTKNSYIDNSAKEGKTYYYKIKALKGKEKIISSAFSKKVKVTRHLARPIVKITKNSSGSNMLRWAKIEGAEKYEIFRSTSKKGPFEKFYTTSKISVIDSSAEPAFLYYYKVKAIDTDNEVANSVFSKTVNLEN